MDSGEQRGAEKEEGRTNGKSLKQMQDRFSPPKSSKCFHVKHRTTWPPDGKAVGWRHSRRRGESAQMKSTLCSTRPLVGTADDPVRLLRGCADHARVPCATSPSAYDVFLHPLSRLAGTHGVALLWRYSRTVISMPPLPDPWRLGRRWVLHQEAPVCYHPPYRTGPIEFNTRLVAATHDACWRARYTRSTARSSEITTTAQGSEIATCGTAASGRRVRPQLSG